MTVNAKPVIFGEMKVASQKIIFRKTLNHYHPQQFTSLWADAEKEFNALQPHLEFIKKSKNPMDARLEVAALFLALIKSMRNHSFNFSDIRTVCLAIARELVRPKNKMQFLLKRFTTKIVTTSIAQKLLKDKIENTKMTSGSQGFVVEYVPHEPGNYLFGFDIVECGICKLFKKEQSEDYAKILCEVDFLTSEIAGLTLIRKNTIANGGNKCDFRFAQKKG